ncbi:hypothetical protein SAMN02745130_00998 [Thiothrix eikelboomii]|uniref:Phage tail assembly chaperone protein, E, or 41 or 14 n=1 Tax=Thiothrix eikelboomii TaxID=92487 RepID=A0A1T4W4P7_9GAMM|nr:phage tail assembly protein [Thiothrix eikelboomii]SKA72203.1 hypothetical protein SAMN02745130_00998 [Thiothrix eikelboomii]
MSESEPMSVPVVDTQKEKTVSGYEGSNSYRLVDPLLHDGTPLKLDGKVIEQLYLRKLRPVECSGINLVDVGMADIGMVLEMLKRSSSPPLGDRVYDLDLPVLTEAAGVFKRFFTERRSSGSLTAVT